MEHDALAERRLPAARPASWTPRVTRRARRHGREYPQLSVDAHSGVCFTLTGGLRATLHRIVDLLTRRARLLTAAPVGVALEVALTVLFAWQEDMPGVAAATGIVVAVLAGAFGGVAAGLVTAGAGWTLSLFFVADETLDALWALPAWLVAGGVAGWLATRAARRSLEREHASSRLAAVREAAAEAIVGFDGNGVIVSWNAGAEALYGYSGEDAGGRPLADLLAGDDAPERADRFVKAVLRGERASEQDAPHRRRDGSDVLVAASVVPLAGSRDEREGVLVARSLGELRRADERFREVQARYRSLTELLPVVTYVRAVGENAAPIFLSPQTDRLFGYTPDEWLADPDLLVRLVHPEDRGRMLEHLAAAPERKEPLRCEYRLVARDGRVVWVRDEAVVVLDGSGRPLCVQGYLMDVSGRKTADEERKRVRAARELSAADARARQREVDFLAEASALLGSSLDYRTTIRKVAALTVRDLADWCIVDAFDEEGNLTRVAAERAEPPPGVPEPAPEPDPEVLEAISRRRAEVSDSRIRVPLVSHGDRAIGALTLLVDGPGRAYRSKDLSWANAVAAAATLAIDNARLYHEVAVRADATRVLTYVGDGVFLVDRTGFVRLWNPMAAAITGLAADAVLGKAAAEAIPGWQEIADRVPIAAAREPARAETLPLETERGERWISISAVGFFGGTVYAFRDITEAHRLSELQAEFIATASHELRTPLAAVYGAAQTLRRHDFALDEAGRERFISLIVDESDRLGRIVNQILLANQLDVGRLDLVTEPFDAAELVERVVDAARTHAPPHISLEVAFEGPVPLVAADKDRARQILVNLVENAIKYSPDGGRIELGADVADGMVLFRVLDEGMGIPPDEQPRIFEKFYRLDPDMTSGIGGTGLGLYICSELVERMGGRIWVESRETKGSAFFFELPSIGPSRSLGRSWDAFGAERPV